MGKCGAFMLQNLVTMVKRSRAKGSPLYRGEPEGWKVISDYICEHIKAPACVFRILNDVHEAVLLDLSALYKNMARKVRPSSFLKASRAVLHSGLSSSVWTLMVSTIRYMILSSTLHGKQTHCLTLCVPKTVIMVLKKSVWAIWWVTVKGKCDRQRRNFIESACEQKYESTWFLCSARIRHHPFIITWCTWGDAFCMKCFVRSTKPRT